MSSAAILSVLLGSAYLVGSIPTALLVGRLFFGIDIRQHGSGNVGSTNALRVLGWQWGLLVQIVDVLKGVVAAGVLPQLWVPPSLPPPLEHSLLPLLTGWAAVVGHCWSPWAGFRGGKGVNTAAGALAVTVPIPLLTGLGAFLLTLAASGYVSLGSLAAAVTVPAVVALQQGFSGTFWVTLGIALTVILRHRSNLERLWKGREYRFQKVWLLRYVRKGSNMRATG
jgi:glycerol-3-phosphate acyltransferase PlsY